MNRLMTAALTASAFTMTPAAYAAEIEIEAEGPVIELSIYESITAEPDIATVGAGVSTDAPTAVEAMRQNAVEMRKVIDRIKSLGIEDKDIQTTGINLNARYDYDREQRRNVFQGYSVSNRVSVKLREIEETGAVLDALVTAGATDLDGPRFSIEDDTSAKAKARERAVERARSQALEYARMLGSEEVRILEINETMVSRSSGPVLRALAVEEAADASMTAPVEPGRVSTGVNITIKFEVVTEEAEEEEESAG